MRILQVITLCELGGAQSVVINLANRLCNNHEVIVAAGEGDGKMFKALNQKIKIERVPSLVRRLSPVNDTKAILELKRLYRIYKPDIIHLHSSKAGILGRIAFPPKKIVYTVHGFDSIRIAYRKFLPIEKLLQKRCAAIVGVSKYDEQHLLEENITNNVSTVYNGIFKPSVLTSNPFSSLKPSMGIILSIARISQQKRVDLFLDIANKLPEFNFVWIGNQNDLDIPTPDNVFFLGNIQNAASYIKYADLFLLPSNYEGLPMVIIEALSSGVPVIASKVGGITELLNNSNGFALENDAELMAAKIKECMNLDLSKKHQMSENAVSTYSKYFTVDNMVNGYLNIYHQIFKNSTK